MSSSTEKGTSGAMDSATAGGSSERGNDPSQPLIQKMEEVEEGMRVDAKDSYGKWFCAKVVEKDEETQEVVVHFDGWSSRYDEIISINEGRLRPLTPELLLKTVRRRKPKVVEVGDRVQARWQDGRMYFGRVLQLLNQKAIVLFDDGVQYTTPITAVRKRNADPSPGNEETHMMSNTPPVERRKRTLTASEPLTDSSKPSTSPPSSPLFAPRRRSSRYWETDDSSATESDEDGGRPQKRDSSPNYHSSDSDLRPPRSKRGRGLGGELREPYKLRQHLTKQQYAPLPRKRRQKGSGSSSACDVGGGASTDEHKEGGAVEACGGGGGGGAAGGKGGGGREGGEGEREAKVKQPPEESSVQETENDRGGEKILVEKITNVKKVKEDGGRNSGNHWLFCNESLSSPSSSSSQRRRRKISETVKERDHDEVVDDCSDFLSPQLLGEVKSSVVKRVKEDTEEPILSLDPPRSVGAPSIPPTQHPPSPPNPQEDHKQPPSSPPPPPPPPPSSSSSKSPQKIRTSRRKVASQNSPSTLLTTRHRAQTAFENSKAGKKKERAKLGKVVVAPKELVITWDHNEFKCSQPGCSKSFRKQTLLESHLKHYHNMVVPAQTTKTRASSNTGKGSHGDRASGRSPQTPTAATHKITTGKTPSPLSLSVQQGSSSTTISPSSSSSSSQSGSNLTPTTSSASRKSSKQRESSTSTKFHEHSGGTGDDKSTPPAGENSTKTDLSSGKGSGGSAIAGGSKSPKKLRQKVAFSKSSASSSLSEVSHSVVSVSKKLHSLSNSHPSSSSSLNLSSSLLKHKHSLSSSSGKRQKLVKEGSRKGGGGGGEGGKKSHISPSLPSSRAAGLPLQRPHVAHGNRGNCQGDTMTRAGPENDLGTPATPSDSGDRTGTNSEGQAVALPATDSLAMVSSGENVTEDVNSTQEKTHNSRSTSPCSEANDDVVHCVCGDNTDEGFMIQCEQCLCWQHGDCIGLKKDSLPRQYICYFCTDPPGLRRNKKYQYTHDFYGNGRNINFWRYPSISEYDLEWYCDGTLPSLPGGPEFPCPQTVLKCHALLDRLHLLRKMSHSSKVKLQAASNPSHAYLRQWSRECASLNKDTLKNYLATALEPIVIQNHGKNNPTTKNTGYIRNDNISNVVAMTTEGEKEVLSNVLVDTPVKGIKLTNGGSTTVSQDSKSFSTLPIGVATNKGGGCVKMSVLTQTSVHSSIPSAGSKFEGQLGTLSERKLKREDDVRSVNAHFKPQSSNTDLVVDFTPEFGVQETAVFATKHHVSSKQLVTQSSQNIVSSRSSTTNLIANSTSSVPPSSSHKKSLVSGGSHSAFKTVVVTAAPRSGNVTPSSPPLPGVLAQFPGKTPTTSQLTSLLTSPLSTAPNPLPQLPLPSPSLPLTSSHGGTPASLPTPAEHNTVPASLPSQVLKPSSLVGQASQQSDVKKEEGMATKSGTQLSRLKLLPNVSGDPIFAKTAASLPQTCSSQPSSSLSPSQVAPVLLQDFTEAFVQGDTTSWFKRMLLLDHLESVQDSIESWVEQMEKEMDNMEEGSEEESRALNCVQETLEQLNRFQCQPMEKAL